MATFDEWSDSLRKEGEKLRSVPLLDFLPGQKDQDIEDAFLPLACLTPDQRPLEQAKAFTLRAVGRDTQGPDKYRNFNVPKPGNSERELAVENLEATLDLGSLGDHQTAEPSHSLILGGPGCGKTRICKTIFFLWATRKKFRRFGAVVYLSGQDTKRCCSCDPNEFFALGNDGTASTGRPGTLALNYLKENPDRLLVVVDAIDEVENEGNLLKEGSVFSQLLGSSISPQFHFEKASVVLTSRQCRLVNELLGQRLCSRHYYLLGFTQPSLDKLFLQCLSDRGDRSKEKLLQLLGQPHYEQLRETIMEMPLLAAMVAMLWEESEGKVPFKVSEVYQQMLDKLMYKAGRHGGNTHGSEVVRRFVIRLSWLALDCLRRNKYTLGSDVKSLVRDDPAFPIRSGILVENQPSMLQSASRQDGVYRFSHFTWLEYFAASAMATVKVDNNDFKSKVKQLAERLPMVSSKSAQLFWLFIAGQVDREQITVLLKTLRGVVTERGFFSAKIRIFLMHCLHEWHKSGKFATQPDEKLQKELLAAVRSENEDIDRIDLNGYSMASKDVRVLADTLRLLPVQVLSLGWCAIAGEHLACLSVGVQNLTRLTLTSINLKKVSNELQKLAQSLRKLESLRLHYCNVDQMHGTCVSIMLKNNARLNDLELIGNEGLGYGGLTRLCDGIGEDCSLKRILLNGSGLGDQFDGDYVGSMLSKAKELQTICFTRNGFTSKHLKTVLPHLAKLQKLQEIWLRYNNIDDSALTAIAGFFRQRCKQLRKAGDTSPSAREGAADQAPENKVASVVIHLDHNPQLGTNKNSKLEELARSMCEMETASDEVVWNCRSVTSRGVDNVNFDYRDYEQAKARKGRAWLNDRGMDDEALERYTSTSMAKDSTITCLMLDGNFLSDDGARSLARYLPEGGRHLALLRLSKNKINHKGFEAIVRALTVREHPNLRVVILSKNPIFSTGMAGE